MERKFLRNLPKKLRVSVYGNSSIRHLGLVIKQDAARCLKGQCERCQAPAELQEGRPDPIAKKTPCHTSVSLTASCPQKF